MPTESWSFDDIKDVCEAIHFIAITIGIGAGVYWFVFRFLRADRAPRVEFDVAVRCVGTHETSRLIEIEAFVRNRGTTRLDVTDCRYSLLSAAPKPGASASGPLEGAVHLQPLFDGVFSCETARIDPGTRVRRVCAAAIPHTVTHVLVNGVLSLARDTETYSASRLIAVCDAPR